MANKIKLEVYTFGFRQPREQEYISLGDIEGTDFKTVFNDFLTSLKVRKKSEKLKKTLKIDDTYLNIDKDLISGVFESGEYGYSSDIIDVDAEDSSKPVFEKKNNHAEVLPFYFLIYAPSNRNKAIILLQRFGGKGINSVLGRNFEKYSKIRFPDLVLDFQQFISKALANHWIENGGISEFSLVSHELPSDSSDRLGLKGYESEVKTIQLKMSAKSVFGKYLNKRVKNYIDNPNNVFFDIKELSGFGLNGDKVKKKVQLTMDGNIRTIDLSDTGKMRPYYDIDNQVKKNADQHPDFESIDEIAKKLVADLLKIDID
tara:strand:+ start:2904 stop:3851 length:948 start_codon:yes stop_codon:yes gene_type:complete